MDSLLVQRAQALVGRLRAGYSETYGFGSMSCAIYDSAWLAQISKEEGGGRKWLFPECFVYVLANQKPDGGWESYASEVDGILNTAASLLALHKHLMNPLQMKDVIPEDLKSRIDAGKVALQGMLKRWDVESTEHVGFEILVPTLLQMLEEAGLSFRFPRRDLLMKLREQKLRKFKPELLYQNVKTTAIHSLEAFIGVIDFDQVQHHKVSGSLMASPSSTAAYLMNASKWDDEAQAYLEHVITAGPGCGSGGAPSAFPSTHFEYSWVLSTLLKAGFSAASLGEEQTSELASILLNALEQEDGTIGFAPLVGSDADDTSKTLVALNFLGKPKDPQRLIDTYEARDHFITYPGERIPSFSANCNVLDALLHSPKPSDYIPQIEKAGRYLYKCWYESNEPIRDKWNHSSSYSTMLMSQSFVKLLQLWDQELLPGINEELVRDLIPLVLFQALSRILQCQRLNGFWGRTDSHEETAYSLLTIAALATLPFVRPLDEEIGIAIHGGRRALESLERAHPKAEYLWIEKVTYASEILHEAYMLAALNATLQLSKPVWKVQSLGAINMKKVNKFLPFYQKLPTIGTLPFWRIRISLMEGSLFAPLLKNVRFEVFPARSVDKKEEGYWDNIRFTWCCVNSLDLTFASADFIVNWMKISYLNYQADEYMEAIVATRFSHNWEAVKDVIEDVYKFEGSEIDPNRHSHSTTNVDHSLTNGKAEVNGDHPFPNGESIANSDHHLRNGESTINNDNNLPNGNPEVRGDDTPPSTPPSRKSEFGAEKKLTQDEVDLLEIRRVLQLLNDWTFTHPQILKASPYQLKETKYEMKMWILGHLIQAEDSHRLAHQKTYLPFETPTSNFYHWVTHVSADHTSCPYAYELLLCFLSDGNDTFPTAEQKYYSASANRHLSTLCRMENDYGSVKRDRLERNLNSVDFPEFGHDDEDHTSEAEQKAQLLRLAQYEREAYKDALCRIDNLVAGDRKAMRKMQLLRVMTNVTDSWGQTYVYRDLGRAIEEITEANAQQLSGQWSIPPQWKGSAKAAVSSGANGVISNGTNGAV